MKLWPLACVAAFALSCGSPPAYRDVVAAARDDFTSPAGKAIRLLEVGIGEANPSAVRTLIGDTYKQHNPRVPDGPQGLIEFVASLANAPAESRPKVKVLRAIVDGPFVALHCEYQRFGRVAAFDLFRVENGKLVEHWDAGEAAEPSSLDGPTAIGYRVSAEENKAVVRAYVAELVAQNEAPGRAKYFAPEAREHPLPDKVPVPLRYERVSHLLGEGNLVLVHSAVRRGEKQVPSVRYDLFRVAYWKIAEHWYVTEEIPSEAENKNGML